MTRRLLVFAIICGICLSGCGRKRAKERVLEAVNPKGVFVTNGQIAVLHAKEGYIAIAPTYVRHNEIQYRAFFSTNGYFQNNNKPITEGVVTTTAQIDLAGTRVFLGYGGENITSVMLDFEDTNSAIALFPTNDLRLLVASRLEFKRARALDSEDLMKAIGLKRPNDTNK